MEILIQVVATIITALIEHLVGKKIDDNFDKKSYCNNYLNNQQSLDQSNYIQTGNIYNSNLNINQTNTSITNNYIKSGNNTGSNSKSSSENALAYIIISILVVCCLIAVFGYLKYKLYFDYWYPILLMMLSVISVFLFKNNLSSDPELIWKKNQHFSFIAFLFFLNILFSFFLFQDKETLQVLDNLQSFVISTTNNSQPIINFSEIFSQSIDIFFRFFFKVALLFLPFIFLCADIFIQIKYKKPVLDTFTITYITAVVIFIPFVISTISSL